MPRRHQGFFLLVISDWRDEAGMRAFERESPFYRSSPQCWLVRLDCIEPPSMEQRQHLGPGGFCRTRMVTVLRGFASQSLPPIELDEVPSDCEYAYQLRHGAHRFYASVAVGFSHVPAAVVSLESRSWSGKGARVVLKSEGFTKHGAEPSGASEPFLK